MFNLYVNTPLLCMLAANLQCFLVLEEELPHMLLTTNRSFACIYNYYQLLSYTGLKLDEKNVVNVLHESKFADGDWEQLGQQLIDRPNLITIRANRQHDCILCMSDTISQWLNNDLEASWEKLANAVVKVERYGEATAHIVRQKAGIRMFYV